jgi:hypothetical protein
VAVTLHQAVRYVPVRLTPHGVVIARVRPDHIRPWVQVTGADKPQAWVDSYSDAEVMSWRRFRLDTIPLRAHRRVGEQA